jgi:hypothetical protein
MPQQMRKAPIKPVGSKKSQASRSKENNHIISGYFINQQSYKQMVIERINACLYCILGILIVTCLVGYYFVTISEVKLNKIQKETLTLNYENEELQNRLDNLQSYYNVDKTVSRTNMLQRAREIMELPAQTPPDIKIEKNIRNYMPSWSMGY